jgi:hypothetical protein
MKRVIKAAAVISVVLFMMYSFLSVQATEEPKCVFSNFIYEKSEDSISIRLRLEKNPGIIQALIYIAHDRSLTLDGIDVSSADIGNAGIFTTHVENVVCVTVDLYGSTVTGELATMEFTCDREIIKGSAFEFMTTAYVKMPGHGTYESAFVTQGECVFVAGVLQITVGDLNGDELVNTADAVVVLSFCAGKREISPEQEAAADFNHDGRINTRDAKSILEFIVQN